MHQSASQPTAFDTYRSLSHRTKPFSLANAFVELIDLATTSISAGRDQEALGVLNQLKTCVQQSKNHIDCKPEMLITHLMTVKVLQLESCELRLELARLRGDEDAISACEEELKQFDLYVDSATADLAC